MLAGLWDFPNIVLEDPEIEESSAEDILLDYLASLGLKELGTLVKKGLSLHIFTHIRRTSLVYAVQAMKTEFPESQVESQGKWVTEEEITEMAVSELGRKVLRLALGVEKKRKSADEGGKPKIKSRKIVNLEKGQTKLAFTMTRKTTLES